MAKQLLLVGGGRAHVHVLEALARQPLTDVEVTLVSPHARQLHAGMVPGLVAGHYTVPQCAIAVPPLAQAAGVQWLEGRVVTMDAGARRVQLADSRELHYDLISLDTGGTISRETTPGAREHALFVRPLEPFVQLLEGLWNLAAQRVLDVVVVGGGASAFELALSLQHRLSRGGEERARVALVTGGAVPLAAYPAGVQARAAAMLARARVTVFREPCAAVERHALVLASGARLACDAPLWATGVSAPPWLADSGLALDARGFVRTGATLQSVSHPEVLAAGDVAVRDDAPHLASDVYDTDAGRSLVRNLRALLAGAAPQPDRTHAPAYKKLNCGARRAIVAWGGLAVPGRLAWWWKDRSDRALVARLNAR